MKVKWNVNETFQKSPSTVSKRDLKSYSYHVSSAESRNLLIPNLASDPRHSL